MKLGKILIWGIAIVSIAAPLFAVIPTASAANDGGFSLVVSPSPLVETVKPGVPTDVELKIRNNGITTESLKIEARAFKYDNLTGDVQLRDTTPPDIAKWITYADPTFTIKPGQWFTQKVHFSLPKDTGFSYSFALLISRKDLPKATDGGRVLNGAVAVFTLINVDRPGATRQLKVDKFVSLHGLYEVLPATVDITFKNTGNTIVQPYGNLFIQRKSNSSSPITTLKVNQTNGYILPGTTRKFQAEWNQGFPAYKTATDADGKQTQTLTWNLDNASQVRFGRYTAKLVAAYNDGHRDVPLEAEVTFWVIPWRAILAVIAILALLIYLFRQISRRRTEKAVQRALDAHKAQEKRHEADF